MVPIKKFADRKTAASRIWNALQNLRPPALPEPDTTPAAKPATKQNHRRVKSGSNRNDEVSASDHSKKTKVLNLLRQPHGVALQAIMAATGWQAHSVRGFLSGTLGKKMGLRILSTKNPGGGRVYRIEG